MADVMTISSSGKAFSVTKARGKLSSPRGQERSVQKLRRCCTAFLICSGVSASVNDGMISEKPLARPPRWIIEIQLISGSRVVELQSLKSGKVLGGSNP